MCGVLITITAAACLLVSAAVAVEVRPRIDRITMGRHVNDF